MIKSKPLIYKNHLVYWWHTCMHLSRRLWGFIRIINRSNSVNYMRCRQFKTSAKHVNMLIYWICVYIKLERRITYEVILASPVGQRASGSTSGISKHASTSSGPAALCIAGIIVWKFSREKAKCNLCWS